LQQLHSVLIDVEPLKQVSDDQATGWEATLGIIQGLSQIMLVLGFPFKQQHSGDLTLGKLSAKLGRYRQHVSMHLERLLAGERTARQSLFLAALMLSVKTHPCAGYEDLACSSKLAYEKALKLKLSRHEARVVGELIALQEPLSRLEATRRSAYHFCREGGESAVAAVLLNLACFLACHKPSPVQKEWDEKLDTARSVLDLAFEEEPQPVIRGNELAQELGIEPGPILGELLEAIREGQMMGEVADRDSALAIAAQRLKKFKEKSR
jgi:tRNA nucleotidyltransferase/poly(A) polymerase